MQRLQELAFYYIVNNFEIIYKDSYLKEKWKRSKIPQIIGQELLTDLNDTFLGINQDYLEMFNRKICCLRKIELNCSNVNKSSTMSFLKNQPIEKAAILNLTELEIQNWLIFLEGKRLRELSIKGCLINYENDERTNKDKILRSILRFKSFKSLRILDISCTVLLNTHLKFLSEELTKLQELNISRTGVTDLRYLERLSQLNYLDCSFPIDERVYDTYLTLLNLKSLKYLDISREDNDGLTEPILRYFKMETSSTTTKKLLKFSKFFQKNKEWSLSDFLENAFWKDMVHFNLSGDWGRPLYSLANFVNRHKKLDFLGLYGYEFDIDELQFYVTNGTDIKQLVRYNDDNRIQALNSMTMMKENIGYETPYMELLEWKSGMGSEDESFKDKVDGINLEVADVLTEQLDHIKMSYNKNKSPAEHAYLAHSIFCMVRFTDLTNYPQYIRLLKSIANIFLNFQDESFWDHDLTYIFKILSQNFNKLNLVCDRNKILSRIFQHSDPKFDETYQGVLLQFIQSLNMNIMSGKEITEFIEYYKQFERKLQLLLIKSPSFEWQFDDFQEIMSEFIKYSESHLSS